MAISAVSSYYVEQTMPAPKLLARDFILGAILLLIIMQVLPESTSNLIQFICGLVAFRLPFPKMEGGGGSSGTLTTYTNDPEVKVGVPTF